MEQTREKRIEPKIHVSRDGKWIIMNVPGVEAAIIKPVSYFKAIIDNAERKRAQMPVNIEQIKG